MMISQYFTRCSVRSLIVLDHLRRRFARLKLCGHFLDLRCLLFRRRCDGGHPDFQKSSKTTSTR